MQLLLGCSVPGRLGGRCDGRSSPAEVAARVDAALQIGWKRLNLAQKASAGTRRDTTADAPGLAWPYCAAAPEAARVPRQPRLRQAHRLVDTLLAEEDFADHWGRASVWAADRQAARGGRDLRRPGAARVPPRRPADQPAFSAGCRGIESSGEGLNEGLPSNFLLRYECKPTDLAGAVASTSWG